MGCSLIPTEIKNKVPKEFAFKESKSGIDCRGSRTCVETHAHASQSRGYRLEAFSQSDVPSTTVDVGRRFVAAVFKLPTTNGDCLDVGTGIRLSPVVDFDPITAEMAPGTSWHPYHVLSALCNVISLERWLELEIQLSGLIRLDLRVHD